MSDLQVKIKVDSLLIESGFAKTDKLACPIAKILHMRHSDIPLQQAIRVANSVLRQ